MKQIIAILLLPYSLAGAKVPTDRKMDGYDLSAVIKSHAKSPRTEFHYWAFAELHAVRSGPWKLHIQQRGAVNYSQLVDMEGPELYNLETDISEKHDRAAAKPDIVDELQAMITKHRKDVLDSTADQLAIRIEK